MNSATFKTERDAKHWASIAPNFVQIIRIDGNTVYFDVPGWFSQKYGFMAI